MRLEILTAVAISIAKFLGVTACSLLGYVANYMTSHFKEIYMSIAYVECFDIFPRNLKYGTSVA